ncbi:MAG: hypothetical protein AMXMBFR56_07910 [Polyangiaceae bacterium]
MRWLMLTACLLACGKAPQSPPASPPAPAAAAPNARPPDVAPAEPAEPAGASLVLPADRGSGQFRGLRIDVVDLVEKRTLDGSGMMRATLRLRADGKDETVELTSDDPKRSWQGYELDYDPAGWRQEVRLRVQRQQP